MLLGVSPRYLFDGVVKATDLAGAAASNSCSRAVKDSALQQCHGGHPWLKTQLTNQVEQVLVGEIEIYEHHNFDKVRVLSLSDDLDARDLIIAHPASENARWQSRSGCRPAPSAAAQLLG